MFSDFSEKTYVVATHKKCVSEAFLTNTHNIQFAPGHTISCKIVCVSSEDSDQPGYQCMLIRVFASP